MTAAIEDGFIGVLLVIAAGFLVVALFDRLTSNKSPPRAPRSSMPSSWLQ